jgi:iron transport multicopper oxidase
MASSMIPFLLALLLSSHLAVAKVVTYNWNLGWITANPDGIVRPVVGINGQFPLPTINVTLGDHIVINAVNSLGNSSATLHFHGIYQNGSTAQDGPYQISQCGIPSGQSLTYSFTVCLHTFKCIFCTNRSLR